ncbi:MAG: serine protease [Planctomycetes bacterium]|nr:serine protease [Planctomycetota bacterium]
MIPTPARAALRSVAFALVTLALVTHPAARPAAAGPLDMLEGDFEKAISRITPATVECKPYGIPPEQVLGGSSGVIVSRKGYIFSDGDVGSYRKGKQGEKPEVAWSDDVEVRVPDLKGKGFRAYRATVIHRNRKVDTSLLRVEDARSGDFGSPLLPGRSDDLRVGDFAFAAGNAFDMGSEAPPTLTAGVVASLTRMSGTSASGRYAAFHVSAAVNPGMNGGPVCDAEGRLVGTISSYVGPVDPHQYLGKVVPIDILRAEYGGMPEGKEIFPEREGKGVRTRNAARMELVFHVLARRAAAKGLVSIEVTRAEGATLDRKEHAGGGKLAQVPGWSSSVSGTLLPDRRHVVTCLYNLVNIAEVMDPGVEKILPETARLEAGWASISSLAVVLPDGAVAPAKLVGRSERDNLAVLELEQEAAAELVVADPAPESELVAGRFVVAVGCPFGSSRGPDPLLTIGLVSKRHDWGSTDPWAGYFQTDAGATDGNAGGLAVDLKGRWIGMLTVWSPIRHGRNSGIGFILPAARVLDATQAVLAGRKPPFLGVSWAYDAERKGMVVSEVVADGPAAKAEIKQDDVIARVAGQDVTSQEVAFGAVRTRWSGDVLEVGVLRGKNSAPLPFAITLGERPAP